MSKNFMYQHKINGTKNFLNEGSEEMIKKRVNIVEPEIDLDLVLQTYNYKNLKNYKENIQKGLPKVCIWNHCMLDKSTYMNWGDYWVKRQLEYSLIKKFGNIVTLVENPNDADIVIYLFGSPYNVDPNQTNICWFYSHPEKMTVEEADKYDYLFCASSKFLEEMKEWELEKCQLSETFLPACTNFKYQTKVERDKDVLFIGNARSNSRFGRNAVMELYSVAGESWDVHLYGAKWTRSKFAYSHKWYKGQYLPYDALPEEYAKARINLIDGHVEMEAQGFVSAKIFDTIASGGAVVVRHHEGIKEIFGDAIKMYSNKQELWQAIKDEVENPTKKKELRRLSKIATKYTYDSTIEQMFSEIKDKFFLQESE